MKPLSLLKNWLCECVGDLPCCLPKVFYLDHTAKCKLFWTEILTKDLPIGNEK